MIGILQGPWFICAAILLVLVGIRRGSHVDIREFWCAGAIGVCAAVVRLTWGVWGPLHVNGQGPLWIRGALDADALVNYGPGYFEIFSWVGHLPVAPDHAIFMTNALLSALSAVLLYATARLAGVERGGALAAAAVLAADAVTIRTAASELYIWPIIALVLASQASLLLFARAQVRGDWPAALCVLTAAGLLATAAVRIHTIACLPLALSPLIIFGTAFPEGWRARVLLAAVAATAIGAIVLLTSGSTILNGLHTSPVTAQAAVGGLRRKQVEWLGALLVAVCVVRRWTRPPWLPLIGVCSFVLMPVIASGFQRTPFQESFYQRLLLPGVLLGAAPLLSGRLQHPLFVLGAAALGAAALLVPDIQYLSVHTTEQLEYGFLQEVLPAMPATCTLATLGRAGKRVWAPPYYLMQSRSYIELAEANPIDTELGDCLIYVHSSLCASAEGRSLCEAAEQGVPLERVASRSFPAVPSDLGLPYDRSNVEVTVFRTSAHRFTRPAPTHERRAASEGAAITPAFTRALYERLVPLREADGCLVMRVDASRFSMTLSLQTRSGDLLALELSTAATPHDSGHKVGRWTLVVPAEAERYCGITLTAIKAALAETESPPNPAGS